MGFPIGIAAFIAALFIFLGFVVYQDIQAGSKFKADCAARGGSTKIISESVGKTQDTDDFCIAPDGRIIDFRD